MAMETNSQKSRDPEQPRDIITPQLVDKIVAQAEAFLLPEHGTTAHPLDIAKVHEMTQEAYGYEGAASSAYLDIAQYSSSLFVTREDGSYTEYRLDASIPESGAQATRIHYTETGEHTEPITREEDMDISDLVMFVRALDSLAPAEDPRSQV